MLAIKATRRAMMLDSIGVHFLSHQIISKPNSKFIDDI